MNGPLKHWTPHEKLKVWLYEEKATLLKSYKGWDFWEHPIYGDEAPVLATRSDAGYDAAVWNTQDFDLPNKDDL